MTPSQTNDSIYVNENERLQASNLVTPMSSQMNNPTTQRTYDTASNNNHNLSQGGNNHFVSRQSNNNSSVMTAPHGHH